MSRRPHDNVDRSPAAEAGTTSRRSAPSRRSEAPAMSDDEELHETLDLLSQVVADISSRLDHQGEVLDRLAETQERFDPNRMAATASTAASEALARPIDRLLDAIADLTGRKAVLRERLRNLKREESRASRWRRHLPLAWTSGAVLLLVLALVFGLPRAMAQVSPTCQAMGGDWYRSANGQEACIFWLEE